MLERLKSLEETAGVPVITFSGQDGESRGPDAIAAGADAYLEKPADERELLELIGATT